MRIFTRPYPGGDLNTDPPGSETLPIGTGYRIMVPRTVPEPF